MLQQVCCKVRPSHTSSYTHPRRGRQGSGADSFPSKSIRNNPIGRQAEPSLIVLSPITRPLCTPHSAEKAMEASSLLKTPATPGRSRFSKALPAPPPGLYTAGRFPPRISNSTSPRPPAPPPKASSASFASANTVTAAGASLPNSPLPPAPPPKVMAIPRRPIASITSMTGLPLPPEPEPSPVTSISSILSAYSNTSGESLIESYESTASTKASYVAASPEQQAVSGDLRRDELLTPLTSFSNDIDLRKQPPAPIYPADGQDRPPPPPVKDDIRPKTPSASQPNEGVGLASPSSLNKSPSMPQLWRRRSLKADRNLAVSELKLPASHGSTASTLPSASASASTPAPAPASTLAPLPDSLTSTSGVSRPVLGLPGRNIRPAASRDLVAQNPTMGESLSKMEARIESKLGRKTDEMTNVNAPPFQRLPTPEYDDHHDRRGVLVETIAQPVSPASSPELPSRDSEPEPELAPQPKQPIIPRKAVGLTGRDIRPVRSTPVLNAYRADAAASAGLHDVPSVLRPGDATASRDATPRQTQFPARTSSRLGAPPSHALRRQLAEAQSLVSPVEAPIMSRDVAPVAEEEPSQETAKASPLLSLSLNTSESVLSRAADDSSATSQSEQAAFFPASFLDLAPPGTIFTAPPLGAKNYMCLQQHRQMYRDRNLHCPLKCQACEREDTEMRWKCKWCYLRICQPCMDYLHENQRDLHRLVDHIRDSKSVEPPPPSPSHVPMEPSSQLVPQEA